MPALADSTHSFRCIRHKACDHDGYTPPVDSNVGVEMERIGPYRLEARLGAGGMGEVWRAWDERLKRRVALKRIQADSDPSLRARFRREAEAGARLSHPSIVQVYDILEDTAGDWLVMELVEGGTLKERLAREPASPQSVITWAREIAEGLAEAHRHGILHRDLKAGNIMLTASGHAKIVDFGLAKRFGTQDLEISLSASGALLGTVPAMSPEQVLGLPLDARSDLFSLGILLFEMVSGQKPFTGESPFETMEKICYSPPAAVLPATGWPPALIELIRQLLSKDPADRPADAARVVAELVSLTGASRAPLPPRGSAKMEAGSEEPTEDHGRFRGVAIPSRSDKAGAD